MKRFIFIALCGALLGATAFAGGHEANSVAGALERCFAASTLSATPVANSRSVVATATCTGPTARAVYSRLDEFATASNFDIEGGNQTINGIVTKVRWLSPQSDQIRSQCQHQLRVEATGRTVSGEGDRSYSCMIKFDLYDRLTRNIN